MSVRVEFRWPEELVEGVDAAAGDVPRSVWVRRAVERALEGLDHSPRRVDVGDRDPAPAPAEQPERDGVPFADPSDRLRETRPRVSPPKPIPPRVPSHPPCLIRRDVKPFPRGDK